MILPAASPGAVVDADVRGGGGQWGRGDGPAGLEDAAAASDAMFVAPVTVAADRGRRRGWESRCGGVEGRGEGGE